MSAPGRPIDALTGRQEAAIACGGFVLALGAAAIGLANVDGDHRVYSALANAATIAILVSVGLIAWAHGRDPRFGRLVVIAGMGWFLVSLATSDVAVLYSVGRASSWVIEAFLIYLFLSYPRGVVETRAGRAVVALAAGTVALLFLPSVFFIEQFPTPSPWTLCTSDCPPNSFAVISSEPAAISDLVNPARELLASAAFLGMAVVLALRLAEASAALRRTIAPVFVAAALSGQVGFLYLAARRAGVDDGTLQVLGGIRNLTLPLAAAGFLAGLLLWRLHEARALERMALSAEGQSSPSHLQTQLQETLGDPSLEIRYRYNGGWINADRDSVGDPTESAEAGDRCVVELSAAAILCDPALEDQRSLVEAAASWITVATERERLNRLLSDSLRDVADSRHRLATAAATERRRIERDLHDGAQQRLVTLRVQLGLLEEELELDPAAGAKRLHGLGPSVEAAIDDVRSLARGIYPPLLADAGVAEALRAVATREAMSVSVAVDDPCRYPLEVESAVYFCCLEALQNTAKHSGTSSAEIEIECEAEEVRFTVRDRGSGIEPGNGASGAGLTNMRDRLAAVGGRLEIESSSAGTCVRGTVPAHAID